MEDLMLLDGCDMSQTKLPFQTQTSRMFCNTDKRLQQLTYVMYTQVMADHLCAMQAGKALTTTNGVFKNARAANLGDASTHSEPQTNVGDGHTP